MVWTVGPNPPALDPGSTSTTWSCANIPNTSQFSLPCLLLAHSAPAPTAISWASQAHCCLRVWAPAVCSAQVLFPRHQWWMSSRHLGPSLSVTSSAEPSMTILKKRATLSHLLSPFQTSLLKHLLLHNSIVYLSVCLPTYLPIFYLPSLSVYLSDHLSLSSITAICLPTYLSSIATICHL